MKVATSKPSDSARLASTNVMRLAWVSLLNDLGSEVLTRLVPLYVQAVLGAPMSAVGAIEGFAEGTATLLKPVFGAWSDRLGRRKPFVSLGYGLSAVSRPLLALAGSWPGVALLRCFDRLGKGVRTAPRDALIAESSIGTQHGRSFGLNRTLDTTGALVSVGLFGLWTWHAGEHQLRAETWKWLALACSVPGFLAVALVALGTREAAAKTGAKQAGPASAKLNPTLVRYLAVVAVFSLANSSDAFILLRARDLGFRLPAILGIIALFNLVAASTSLPAAVLSDRLGRRALIALGWLVYAVSYGLMGTDAAQTPVVFILIVATYGLFYGFTEGVERAWIADLAPAAARGRAYGAFGLVVGIAALPASAGFGWAWDHFGATVPFLISGAIALLAAAGLFWV